MKKLCLFCFSLLISASGFAQTRSYFALSDSVFKVGSVYAGCRIDFDLDGCGLLPYSNACLDTFALFLIAHPELVIEIGSHTDQRGADSTNLKLSQSRATVIEKYLEGRGVSTYSLAAVGYGEQYPIKTQSQIDAAVDRVQKEWMYKANRRTEFKILYVYPETFSMTDSTYQIGDVMRLQVVYDFGKATIRPESYPLLDSLAKFLILNPQLVVEIGGHTDARGSDTYSIKLSDVRARAVFEYLLTKGVSRNNMKYTGYSDTKPLVPAAMIYAVKSKQGQEELHQLNRRTEIKIISFW